MKLKLTPVNLVYVLLALLPFERLPSVHLMGINWRVSMVAGLVLIGWLVWRRPVGFWPRSPIQAALYGFLGVNFISALISSHAGRALAVTGFLSFVALLALAVAQLAPELDLKVAKRAVLTGALIACGLGLYQFGGDLVGLPLGWTGLKPAYSSQVFGFPRVQAASLEPLYLANFLLLPLALVLASSVTAGAAAVLGLFYLISLLSLSRGGVAAAAGLSLILVAVKLARRQWGQAGLAVGALSVSAIIAWLLLWYAVPVLTHYRQSRVKVVETYTRQLTSYEIGNTGVDRAQTRQLALELWRSHKFLGAGPGTFGYYAHQRDAKFTSRQIVNNEPLELLAETGLVGLAAWLTLVVILAWTVGRAIWRETDGQTKGWLIGLLAFLMAVAIQYWSFSTLYIMHLWVAVGLLIGLSRTIVRR